MGPGARWVVVGASAGLAAIVFLANATAVIVVPDGWECQPAVDSVRLVRFKWSLIIMPRRAEPPLARACDDLSTWCLPAMCPARLALLEAMVVCARTCVTPTNQGGLGVPAHVQGDV